MYLLTVGKYLESYLVPALRIPFQVKNMSQYIIMEACPVVGLSDVMRHQFQPNIIISAVS